MKQLPRVLIVDDDAPTRMVLRDQVRRTGDFEILEAADGFAGTALARERRPDLILLDLMMPDRTGYEVCADLRADPLLREVPIIVLSAAEESAATVAALEAGADDFLRKPCAMPELRAKIGNIARLNRFRVIAHERERFRWLLDHSLEPLAVVRPDGTLVFANGRAREVFGLPAESGGDIVAAIARNFRCDPLDAWAQLQARAFAPGPSFAVFQPEGEHAAARWFDLEVRAAEDGGEVLLKFTDRTGWVRRELETWSFQHLIAHKVRTPLSGLGGTLEMLGEIPAVTGDAEAAGLLGTATANARRLERDLLAVLQYHSALFRGGAPAEAPAPAGSLADLVREAATAADLPRIAVAELDAVPAAGLAASLRLVLREVCENYAKFSRARSAGLDVTAAPAPAGLAALACFAPGAVPPPDVVAQLGRPYWQLQARFTGEIAGMGLGVATARLLMRSRGGDLTFAAAPGAAGLVTTLTFPAATPTPAEPTPIPALA